MDGFSVNDKNGITKGNALYCFSWNNVVYFQYDGLVSIFYGCLLWCSATPGYAFCRWNLKKFEE